MVLDVDVRRLNLEEGVRVIPAYDLLPVRLDLLPCQSRRLRAELAVFEPVPSLEDGRVARVGLVDHDVFLVFVRLRLEAKTSEKTYNFVLGKMGVDVQD